MPEAGLIPSFTSPGFHADPYAAYDRLLAAAPVAWSTEESAWLLSRYADLAAVLADPGFQVVEMGALIDKVSRRAGKDAAALRAFVAASVVVRNPPVHTEQRRFLGAVLTSRALSSYAPVIEKAASDLLATARSAPAFDAATAYADRLPPQVMGRLLGLSADALAGVVSLDRLNSPRFYERASRAVAAVQAVLEAELARRRREPRPDGLTRMIELTDQGAGLADDEIARRALVRCVAGIHTTSALIGGAIKTVLERPGLARRLAADPALIARAVEEVIRFDGPVQQFRRRATRDCVIGGQPVRADDHLVLLLGAAHRDPAAYSRPNEFDIGRPGPPHLGFGHGLHSCIGAPLARLEAQLALKAILALRPRLVPGVACSWWSARTWRRLKRLPVTFPRPSSEEGQPIP